MDWVQAREALSQLLCWQSQEAGVSSAAGTRSLRGSWSSVARQGTPQCQVLAFQVRHAFFLFFLMLREAAIARMLFFFFCLYCFSQVLNPFLCWNTPRYPAVVYWVHLCYSIPAECASSPRGSWTIFFSAYFYLILVFPLVIAHRTVALCMPSPTSGKSCLASSHKLNKENLGIVYLSSPPGESSALTSHCRQDQLRNHSQTRRAGLGRFPLASAR